MAVNYNATLKNTRMNDVLTAIDVSAPGTMEIGTSAFGTTLVTITLASPAGTVTGAVLTLTVPKSGTAGASGTAALARIKDGAGTVVVSGLTVGTSATDIIITNTSIASGDTVTMTAGTITHSA